MTILPKNIYSMFVNNKTRKTPKNETNIQFNDKLRSQYC